LQQSQYLLSENPSCNHWHRSIRKKVGSHEWILRMTHSLDGNEMERAFTEDGSPVVPPTQDALREYFPGKECI
jgi:hypothetical protein